MEVEQGEARAGEEFEEEGDKPTSKGKAGAGKDERLYDEVTIQGLPIVVETKQGEIRTGKDFEVAMPADYGFIKGTIGADGDEVDCYVGPNIHSKMVYVVNQKKLDSEIFDEHKCMLGFDSVEQALMAYAEGHHRSNEAFMSCKEMNMTTFKLWLRASAHTEPVQGGAKDTEFNESDHPRADNGQFGAGDGSESKESKSGLSKKEIEAIEHIAKSQPEEERKRKAEEERRKEYHAKYGSNATPKSTFSEKLKKIANLSDEDANKAMETMLKLKVAKYNGNGVIYVVDEQFLEPDVIKRALEYKEEKKKKK